MNFCKQFSDHFEGFETLYEEIKKRAELPEQLIFLECGVRQGGSSLLFLSALENTQHILITIDPYGTDYPSGTMWPAIGEDSYRDCMARLFRKADERKITHVHYRMKSQWFIDNNVLESLYVNNKNPKSFAFVYLDGEHTDEAVIKELEYFSPKMINGGMIAVDDISYLKNTKNEFLAKTIANGFKSENRLYIECG